MYQAFLIILISSLSLQLSSQDSHDDDLSRIASNLDSLFEFCYSQQLFNGIVTVNHGGQNLFEKPCGTVGPNLKQAISSDTPFLLASLSKQFTAFGIVLLKSKGMLNYDDLVQNHLEDFPYSGVTIRHLLNHSAGLPEYTEIVNARIDKIRQEFEESGKVLENRTIASMFAKNQPPLIFSTGTSFDYSNTGYLYLALIIESISDMSYAEFMEQFIFSPLNMKHSFVIRKDSVLSKVRAIGYKLNPLTGEAQENEMPNFVRVVGDGGVYSSVNDLKLWYAALDNNRLVSALEMNEVYTTPLFNEDEGPYGFGWFVRELPFNQHKIVTHSGQFVGFTNAVFRDLDDQITAVMLSNNSHDINSQINSAVMRIIYGMPFQLPKIDSEVILTEIIVKNGINAAKEFYDENQQNEVYDFSEKSLNTLGYKFLKADKANLAISIFKWIIKLHPDSSNAYDSLGEAYLSVGNNSDALVNYQKSFEIDSSNTNAEVVIQKLKLELSLR